MKEKGFNSIYKVLILLIVMLVAMCIFGLSEVQAVDIEPSILRVDDVLMAENNQVLQTTVNGARYNKSNNTLTLENYNGSSIYVLNMGKNFKIEVKGKNTVKAKDFYAISGPAQGNGELETDCVTFVGDGSLYIEGSVFFLNDITFNGPDVYISDRVGARETSDVYGSNINILNGDIFIDVTKSNTTKYGVLHSGRFNIADGYICTNGEGSILYQTTIQGAGGNDGTITFTTTQEYDPDNVANKINIVKNKEQQDKNNINIYINNTEIAKDGKSVGTIKGVSYDEISNTLTLNNCTIDTLVLGGKSEDFKIKVIGNNTIKGKVIVNGHGAVPRTNKIYRKWYIRL